MNTFLLLTFLFHKCSSLILHKLTAQDGCILRFLTTTDNLRNQRELFSIHSEISHLHPLVLGNSEFFRTTKFSLSKKSTKLTLQHPCNIYIVPPKTVFNAVSTFMTSSGFMFTEKAWFLIITDQENEELWTQFKVGVDADDFPALYTKLLFILRTRETSPETYFFYCWLCPEKDRFQKLPLSLLQSNSDELTKFHKTFNWAGRGLLSYIVTSTYGLQAFASPETNCLQESVKELKTCLYYNNYFTIVWNRLNISSRVVQYKATSEDFDHTLYITLDDGNEDIEDFLVSTNIVFETSSSFHAYFIYCKTLVNYIQPNWKVLLDPLDRYTWTLLLASSGVVVLVEYRSR